jgi:hypothetical protein
VSENNLAEASRTEANPKLGVRVRLAANDWTPLCRSSNSENRRVEPENVNGRKKFKVVYVVLESQYQASMTVACKRINAAQVIPKSFFPSWVT